MHSEHSSRGDDRPSLEEEKRGEIEREKRRRDQIRENRGISGLPKGHPYHGELWDHEPPGPP